MATHFTPVFLPGKSHGQRSQAGYSPRGCKSVRHTLATKTTTELWKRRQQRQVWMGKDDVLGCRSLRWKTPPFGMDLSPVWEAAVSVTKGRTAAGNTPLSQISGGRQRQVQKLTQDTPHPNKVSCALPACPLWPWYKVLIRCFPSWCGAGILSSGDDLKWIVSHELGKRRENT